MPREPAQAREWQVCAAVVVSAVLDLSSEGVGMQAVPGDELVAASGDARDTRSAPSAGTYGPTRSPSPEQDTST